jgi:hypothetical protein
MDSTADACFGELGRGGRGGVKTASQTLTVLSQFEQISLRETDARNPEAPRHKATRSAELETEIFRARPGSVWAHLY